MRHRSARSTGIPIPSLPPYPGLALLSTFSKPFPGSYAHRRFFEVISGSRELRVSNLHLPLSRYDTSSSRERHVSSQHSFLICCDYFGFYDCQIFDSTRAAHILQLFVLVAMLQDVETKLCLRDDTPQRLGSLRAL
jgi:hypothetical protein